MDIHSLNIETARVLLNALEYVLDSRTHKRDHLGEEIIVKGSLSKALKVPELKRTLSRSNETTQKQGIDQLSTLWLTLSDTTQQAALDKAELYDPKKLNWDDLRSNRRPV